jgi:hypothetical protein
MIQDFMARHRADQAEIGNDQAGDMILQPGLDVSRVVSDLGRESEQPHEVRVQLGDIRIILNDEGVRILHSVSM